MLHYHATGAKVWLPKDQQPRVPVFPADAPVFEGDSGEMLAQEDVELFINSEYVSYRYNFLNAVTNMSLQEPDYF